MNRLLKPLSLALCLAFASHAAHSQTADNKAQPSRLRALVLDTPAGEFSQAAQRDGLKALLTQHPDLSVRTADDCSSLLHEASQPASKAAFFRAQMIELLLQAGANPNVTKVSSTLVQGRTVYLTPMLQLLSTHYTGDYLRQASTREWRETQVFTLQFYLKYGADPRLGGVGGKPQSNSPCHPPSAPGRALASEWAGFSHETSHAGLTSVLANTAAFPKAALDGILKAAAPIGRQEIGYPAIHSFMFEYKKAAYFLDSSRPKAAHLTEAQNESYVQALQTHLADLEYGIHTLIDLGAVLNPPSITLSKTEGWSHLWSTTADLPPLYQLELPDALYERLLSAGASPAIVKTTMNSPDISVVRHLVRYQAAGKLAALSRHLGALERVPPWCGQTVVDLLTELLPPGTGLRASPKLWQTAVGEQAKHIVLRLLKNPSCRLIDNPQAAEQFKLTGDSQIDKALSQTDFWRK